MEFKLYRDGETILDYGRLNNLALECEVLETVIDGGSHYKYYNDTCRWTLANCNVITVEATSSGIDQSYWFVEKGGN